MEMSALKARAIVRGGDRYPAIRGEVKFYEAPREQPGTIVEAVISGLPAYLPAPPGGQPRGPFGFHIHDFPECLPAGTDNPFSKAGSHYNPDNDLHGNHAGDLPVLWAPDGRAYLKVFTARFLPEQVIGRSVMIHENPDDYRTQPSGNSGARIACGTIIKV